MVDAHHHHILLCQRHARVPCRSAGVEATPMQPHHYRLARLSVGGPHIQHTRVFLRHLSLVELSAMNHLHRLWSPVVANPYRVPPIHSLRRLETLHLGVWNTEESHGAILLESPHPSRGGFHHKRIRQPIKPLLCLIS